jgi:hypothetical protein
MHTGQRLLYCWSGLPAAAAANNSSCGQQQQQLLAGKQGAMHCAHARPAQPQSIWILLGFRLRATTGGMLSKAAATAVKALVCCCAVRCARKRHALSASTHTHTHGKYTANRHVALSHQRLGMHACMHACMLRPLCACRLATHIVCVGPKSKLTSYCSNQICNMAVPRLQHQTALQPAPQHLQCDTRTYW